MNKRAIVGGALLVACVSPIVAVALSYRSVVRRTGMSVVALPPYGAELRRALSHSPADRDPHERSTYTGPGWYARQSPDGAHRAVTTSWGGFVGEVFLGLVVDRAFYHTVSIWDERAHRLTSIVSIKEADPHSGIAHRYAWSSDSEALLIYGRGRLPEDYDVAVEMCLVYLPRTDKLYRLGNCPPPWQRRTAL